MWKTAVDKTNTIQGQNMLVTYALSDQVFGTKMNIWFAQLTKLTENKKKTARKEK